MSTRKTKASGTTPASTPTKRRKAVENTAAFGMLIICAGLMIPLFNLTSLATLNTFKWIYTAGTAVFLIARLTGATDRSEPVRVRRIRRMEFWAGICFGAGAFMWFWKENHLGAFAGPLAVVRDTILLSLAGACIQIIASWLLYYIEKKHNKNNGN